MESLNSTSCFMDDLLDFASDIGEDDDEEDLKKQLTKPFSLEPPFLPLPEFAEEEEEELEWISNKDAFPTVETFTGMSSLPKHNSPVSVLEPTTGRGGITVTNYCGSLRVPVKARSKCLKRRRREIPPQLCWWSEENMKVTRPTTAGAAKIGRKCLHCGSEKTPQWRAGPMGPKTLCNACGVRFKSGRLVPEYRPASSPSFCSELHSNSHRKVLEMRKQKQTLGLAVVKPMEKG